MSFLTQNDIVDNILRMISVKLATVAITVSYVAVRLLFPELPEVNQMIHTFSTTADSLPDGPLVLSRLDDLSW